VNLFVTESRDGGQTWTITNLATSGSPYPCSNCGFAFLGAAISMTVGSDDRVYILYNSTVDQTNTAPERIFFVTSSDHGASYSARQDISSAPQGIEHSFPAITSGTGSGDVRIGWMDTRTGSWNVFYRASTNGGSSWSGETQISTYVPGYSYLTPNGFGLPYGDYFQMSVDDHGSSQIAWGESASYAGPGNIWTAHN
ncbi:MAG: sialidase family protein, partial [Ktedonobacteraceae bacterium]